MGRTRQQGRCGVTTSTASAPLRVERVLFVDLGEGREDRRSGAIHYTRQPRARYECLLCGGREGPVSGPEDVRAFVAGIRTDHLSRCNPREIKP